MSSKSIVIIVILLIMTVSFTPVYAITELQRTTIINPRIENTFGSPITGNININHQIQISADIQNHQEKSQNFVYLVQIKDQAGLVISLGWISGQLSPNQKLSPSLSWSSNEGGEFIAEIFVWEGLKNHNALSEPSTLQINVS